MKTALLAVLLSSACFARSLVTVDNLLGSWQSDSSFEEVIRLAIVNGDTLVRERKDTAAASMRDGFAATFTFVDGDSVDVRVEMSVPELGLDTAIEGRSGYTIAGDSVFIEPLVPDGEMNGAAYRDGNLVLLDMTFSTSSELGDTTFVTLVRSYGVYSSATSIAALSRSAAAGRGPLPAMHVSLAVCPRWRFTAPSRAMHFDLSGRRCPGGRSAAAAFVQRALRR